MENEIIAEICRPPYKNNEAFVRAAISRYRKVVLEEVEKQLPQKEWNRHYYKAEEIHLIIQHMQSEV